VNEHGCVNPVSRIFGRNVRAADAKEVGVGNPAEETYRYPNKILLLYLQTLELAAGLSIFLTGLGF
jgi:hypothetical protein